MTEDRIAAALERIASAFEVIAGCLVAEAEREEIDEIRPYDSKLPRTLADGPKP